MLAWPLVFAKGLLIGIANIIPGVSGGTFALLLGIYERLVGAIRSVNLLTLRRARGLFSAPGRKLFREEWKRIDGTFLLVLAAGAIAAIVASSRPIKYLLAEHPAPTLAFFAGLVLPSLAVPYGLMKRRGALEAGFALAGAALVVGISFVDCAGAGQAGYLVTFLCAILAISAMILPGISGSFLLLILGQYGHIIEALDSLNSWAIGGFSPRAFPWAGAGLLGAFCAGAGAGLAAFTRLLAWLLKRFHSQTMGFLVGLIVGSLWTLWPFKDYASAERIPEAANVWPARFDATVAWSLLAFAAGLAAAAGVMLVGRARTKRRQEGSDPRRTPPGFPRPAAPDQPHCVPPNGKSDAAPESKEGT